MLLTGASGRTGRYIATLLGPRVRGLVRRAEQGQALINSGGEAVVGDLILASAAERRRWLESCEGVIFAAGASAGGNPEALDNLATVKLIEAAQAQGVTRFILISSLGTDRPEQMPPMLRPFLNAKRKAEKALVASGLEYTIIRPGGLSEQGGVGLVRVAPQLGRSGIISRQDVAGATVLCLDKANTVSKTFDIIEGATPLPDALDSL